MTREQFTSIARSVINGFDPADIDRPIDDTSLDSMDLLLLRSALETSLGSPICDEDWFSSDSLSALLARLS